jgi:DNA-binding NarL/FixJ family response regulator
MNNGERKLLTLLASGAHPSNALQSVSNNTREKRVLKLMADGVSLPNAVAAVNTYNSTVKLHYYQLLRRFKATHNNAIRVVNTTNLHNLFTKLKNKKGSLNRLNKYVLLRINKNNPQNHNMALLAVL